MSVLAEVSSRTTKRRISLAWFNADLVFGCLMLLVALLAMATYGLDLSFAFF